MGQVSTNIYAGKLLLSVSETLVARYEDNPLSIFIPTHIDGVPSDPLGISLFFQKDVSTLSSNLQHTMEENFLKILITNPENLSFPSGTVEPIKITHKGRTYSLTLSIIPLNKVAAQFTFSIYEKSLA